MPAATLLQLSNIPAFPPVAVKLLRSLSNGDCDVREISELISSDAVLSGRILRYANSPIFRFVLPISSIQRAVALIGIEEVHILTLTASVAGFTKNAQPAEQQRCWKHSVATAILAEEIARATDHPPESLYAAGLLHDIGRLGLLAAYPKQYVPTMQNSSSRLVDPLDFERETFGIEHTEAGRWLCEHWKLPEIFQLVAGRHHDSHDEHPANEGHCSAKDNDCSLRITRVACRLASYFGYDVVKPMRPPSLDEIVGDLPPQLRETLKSAVDQTKDNLEQALAAFTVD